VSGFGKAKKHLDREIAAVRARATGKRATPMAPWRLHDLRRTMRTRLSELGVLPVVAELVIGHKQQGIAAVYDLHRYDEEKRRALEAWEQRLRSIVDPQPAPPANVVAHEEMEKRRKGRKLAT
jgi:integrase